MKNKLIKLSAILLCFLFSSIYINLKANDSCHYDAYTYIDELGYWVTFCPVGAHSNAICWRDCPEE